MSAEKEGIYHGCRGVLGSEQYATKNDKDQIAVDVFIPELERSFTTFLYFSDAAAPYAIERLRALGWQGDDLSNLTGIDQKDVDIELRYEMFDGKRQLKVEIRTGGGRVKLENQMDERQKRAFAARMKAFIAGNAGGSKASSQPARPAASTTQRREGAYDPGPPDPQDDIPF